MRSCVLLAALAGVLLAPSAAFGSLAGEEHQGQVLAGELQSGARSCSGLSAEDLDHIGEYVMGRFLGSTAAHEAMNERMRAMMGDTAEGRMHQILGARFAGCAAGGSADSRISESMMGSGGMMGGYSGNGGWRAMMRSGEYSWMMGGTWQSMSRSEWQRLQRSWLGTTADPAGGSWGTSAIAAAAAGAALLTALLAYLVRRRPFRHPRANFPA